MNMMARHPAPSPDLSHSLNHTGRILALLLMILTVPICLSPAPAYPESPVLSWDTNTDADYYQVYMRSEGEREYTLVSGRIPSGTPSFKLMPAPDGAVRYYSVKAFTTCGNASDYSDEIPSAHVPYTPQNPTPVTGNSGTVSTLPVPLSLEIILPEDGAFVTAGTFVEFSANVFMGDTLHTDYMVTWTSSVDGYLGTGLDMGTVLSPGVHIVMATSTGESGETASATMLLYVQEPNTAPEVRIVLAQGGEPGPSGQAFTFKGTAVDRLDGDLGTKILWTSSKSGRLGTGTSIFATLSPGVHTITASVLDSGGLAGKATQAITVAACNHPPELAPGAHEAGFLEKTGQAHTLRATATDVEDGDLSAFISWTSSINGYLGTGSQIETRLFSGEHTITVSVTDRGGETVSRTMEISVGVFNASPTLALGLPIERGATSSGTIYDFTGNASDAEDGSLNALIMWVSDKDGTLGTGAAITCSLSPGIHTLSASVNDSLGKTATKTLSLTVPAPNGAPAITITASVPGVLDAAGQAYSFSARAIDPEDGNLGASITWTSSINGTLGTGASLTVFLPPGTHRMTATVVDKQGKTAAASRTVTVTAVNNPPSVNILSASQGTLTATGQPFIFKGSATDSEDGNLASVITWVSSLDGTLGAGATLTRTLSSGQHLVKARVTDKGGKTAEATKTLTVAVFNHPPVVTPVSSLKGASMSNGQTYTFASSASDKEDGDLSPAILWVSSQSGFLGKGAAIQTVLQPGVHVLTAKATDKGGKTAVVTKTMSVESVNLLPSVQILQVSPGAAGSQGQLHELTGAALDEEDGNLTHTLAWSSNLDGNLGEGSPVVASLRTGTHTLTARACDKRGGCFSVSRSVTVVPFNHPPSVEIVSVVGSRQDTKGQAFELRGKATDKEEGGLSGKIVWTSNRDGRLGQAEAIKPRLSHGTHTITAKVKDSKGKESSKTVTVTSFKTPRLELTVSTKRIFSLRQVKTSWKGGSSGVEIFRDGVKVETGPNQGTRYYWLRKKAAITVCDTLNPAVSVTRTTK